MNISLPKIFFTLAALMLCLLPASAQSGASGYQYIEVPANSQHIYEFPVGGSGLIVEQADSGFATINSNPFGVLYTPNPGFVGLDTVSALVLQSGPTKIVGFSFVFNVKPSVVTATPDFASLPVDASPIVVSVLDNDLTSAGSLKIATIAYAQYGLAELTADSTAIVFTPEAGFTGNAGLVYTVCNDLGACDNTELKILVHEDPQPLYRSWNLPNGEYKTLTVLLPGAGYTLSQSPVNGAVVDNPASPLTFDYIPTVGSTGLDSFAFTNIGGQEVEFFIDNVNEPAPNLHLVEDNIFASTDVDTIRYNLLDNDFLNNVLNKNKLSISKQPQFGTVTLDKQTGIITYVPNLGFEGVDEFEYRYYVSSQGILDYAPVRVSVSDHRPIQTTFDLNSVQNTPFVIDHNAPIRDYELTSFSTPTFGSVVYYPGDTTLILAGQSVSGYNMLVYYPATDYFTEAGVPADEFEYQYCVGSECSTVKVVMTVAQQLPNDPAPCVGRDCIWPGDANTDGVVDVKDLLLLGIGMGEDGNSRADADISWRAQQAPIWEEKNYPLPLQYADADGDRFVTDADKLAVTQNYGKISNVVPRVNVLVKDKLNYNVLTPPPYQPGDLIQIEIEYGTQSNPVIDGYGFALNFNYNSNVIVDSSITVDFYSNSWLGYSSPLLNDSRLVVDGRLDIGLSRTNFEQVTGYGGVLTVNIVIEDDIAGIRYGDSPTLRFSVQGGSGMNSSGQFAGLNDLFIELPLTLGENIEETPLTADRVIAYPNPATDAVRLHVNDSNAKIQSVELFTLTGQQVSAAADVDGRRASIAVSQLQPGMYIARVQTTEGVISKKIQVVR